MWESTVSHTTRALAETCERPSLRINRKGRGQVRCKIIKSRETVIEPSQKRHRTLTWVHLIKTTQGCPKEIAAIPVKRSNREVIRLTVAWAMQAIHFISLLSTRWLHNLPASTFLAYLEMASGWWTVFRLPQSKFVHNPGHSETKWFSVVKIKSKNSTSSIVKLQMIRLKWLMIMTGPSSVRKLVVLRSFGASTLSSTGIKMLLKWLSAIQSRCRLLSGRAQVDLILKDSRFTENHLELWIARSGSKMR